MLTPCTKRRRLCLLMGRPLPSCQRLDWYFCNGSPPNRTSTFRWIRLSSVGYRGSVSSRASGVDRLMARSAGDQGLATPCAHRLDPFGYGWPPRALEGLELSDV